MELISIPDLDIDVSRIALGTWAIGGSMWGGTDEEESVQTIRKALDIGINIIDTAPAYGDGRSEEIVGRAVWDHGNRDEIVIATKAGIETRGSGVYRNASRERIVQEAEQSLRRLKTHYIDIYQVHWPDPITPLEETAEAMFQLYKQGKIRAVGVSNFTLEQMDAFSLVAPLHTVQPPFNLFERQAEIDVLPYAQKNNIATLTYGALCRGLLSGRMRAGTQFHGDDIRKADPKFQAPRYGQYLRAVEKLAAYAHAEYGRTVLELAVRWVLDQPGVSVAIWGARRPSQLDALDGVMGWSLSEKAMVDVQRIVTNTVIDPVGPEFMAPPARNSAARV